MENELIVTKEQWLKELMEGARQSLREDGWTEEQIAAWEQDADALADFFEPV